MNNTETAEYHLRTAFGLSSTQLDNVIALSLKNKREGAFCDVYLQSGTTEQLILDQGVLKNPTRSIVKGAGVRVVIGDKTGYSYTDNVNITNLRKAAGIARTIADHSRHIPELKVADASSEAQQAHNLYPLSQSLMSVSLEQKLSLLRSIDELARAYDPRIQNVTAALVIQEQVIVIATSFGDVLFDKRPMLRLMVNCLAQDGNRRETGSAGGGGRLEFSHLFAGDRWRKYTQDAAKQAIEMLSAEAAPAGEMTVVLASGWPGVLIHESVGHPLEGDFNRKGSSAFSGLMGQKVASPLCTIIDDGALPGRRGSLNFDDEGSPTQQSVLIENGILKGYLQDRMNGGLMGKASTGSGRREGYQSAPIPRMNNTYLAGGKSTPEEIIESIDSGLYVVTMSGGQVDITSGNFTFSAPMAYQIENGKLTKVVKGATLIGNGPKALHNISMVGNDMALDEGIGVCGKDGQSVAVCVGMPTVRLDRTTVGGTRS